MGSAGSEGRNASIVKIEAQGRCRRTSILIALIMIKLLIMYLVFSEKFQEFIDEFIRSYSHRPLLLVSYFSLLYIAGQFVLFPPSILYMATSMAFVRIWGPLYGPLYSILLGQFALSIAFALVFLCARYLFSDCAESIAQDYPSYSLLNRAVKKHGAKIVALIRCTYIIPQSMITYAFATTDISMRNFMLGS
jgi:uncharacterized membrane protein YdjX (TVP38/TMEM64 family)